MNDPLQLEPIEPAGSDRESLSDEPKGESSPKEDSSLPGWPEIATRDLSKSNVIRDGSTRPGFLADSEDTIVGLGDWRAIKFEYRPCPAEHTAQIDQYIEENGSRDPKVTTQFLARQVSARIVWWDQTKGGEADFESVRRLGLPCLKRLYEIISGWRASDPFPGEGIKPEEPSIDLQLGN